jgi:hypothetical protein
MLEFKALKSFFSFLNVLQLLKHHWNDSPIWVMIECMHRQIIKKVKKIVLSCDEVTTIDNQSWISIYSYVVQVWCQILVFISLKQVANGGGVNNLTKVIMGALKKHDGLYDVDVVVNLISFGADGVNVF